MYASFLPVIDDLDRRRFLGGAAATGALILGGCAQRAPADQPAAEDSAVSIEHRLGSTVIPANPERIVTVGWNDQDFVLALGVVPVGIREWFEEYSGYPWVTEVTGGEELDTIGSEIQYEKIAAAQPDVILAVYEEFGQDVYGRLSEIAPTVLQPKEYGDGGTPWDVQTMITGRAIGREDRAREVVEEVNAKINQSKNANPDFEGKTLVVDYGPNDDGHWLVPDGDPRRAIFDALGFAAQPHSKELSNERLDLVDEDVLFVFGASRKQMMRNQVFAQLDVVAEDRTLYVGWDATLAGALSFSGPAAIRYALDVIVPELAHALDGDPDTVVGSLDD